MIELKACPFCGGDADCNNNGFMMYGTNMWAVECVECGCVSAFFDSEEDAAAAWNRRAHE